MKYGRPTLGESPDLGVSFPDYWWPVHGASNRTLFRLYRPLYPPSPLPYRVAK